MTIAEGCPCRQKINMEIEFTILRKQRKQSWRLIIKDSPCHHLDISWPSLSKKEGWRGDNQGLSFSDTWKLPIHHSSTTVHRLTTSPGQSWQKSFNFFQLCPGYRRLIYPPSSSILYDTLVTGMALSGPGLVHMFLSESPKIVLGSSYINIYIIHYDQSGTSRMGV